MSRSAELRERMSRIAVVLVRTSHPGNIGSAARAMKTMGLSRLVLAAPETPVTAESYALAAGAGDILDKAVIRPSLAAALEGAELAVAASARLRRGEKPVLDPRAAAATVRECADCGRNAALVFGCERTGLTNQELEICHCHVTIDADEDYSSLNLAMAVQVLCHETRCAFVSGAGDPDAGQQRRLHEKDRLADGEEIAGFYRHLEASLLESGFLKTGSDPVLRKVKRIFTRDYLTRDDINILRGALSSMSGARSKRAALSNLASRPATADAGAPEEAAEQDEKERNASGNGRGESRR